MSRSDENKSVSRREVLTTIGVASAAAVLVSSTGSSAHSNARENNGGEASQQPVSPVESNGESALDAKTAALFAPIMAAGFVGSYRVVAVHPMKLGAIPVVLATSAGREFQVDLHRHDQSIAGTNGIRSAGPLTVSLHNVGRGDVATSEEEGLGAMALLEAVAHHAETASLPALLTIHERSARFPVT